MHVLKETRCFLAQTEDGKDVQIPLNLSEQVIECQKQRSILKYEKFLDDATLPQVLKNMFPDKYDKVYVQSNLKNCLDSNEIYRAGDSLDVVEFDISRKHLVCLNKEKYYVRFDMHQLTHLKVADVTMDLMFLAEVHERFKLPVLVRFEPQTKFKGFVTLKKVVTLQTVIASRWQEDSRIILTFPANLDISLVPPSETTINDPTYLQFLDGVHGRLNVDKIKGIIGPCEVYFCLNMFLLCVKW